jgi:hypothetical protein
MRYVKDDDGRLNNFAIEPKMYTADPLEPTAKRSYLVLALVGAVLVGGLIFVASSIS